MSLLLQEVKLIVYIHIETYFKELGHAVVEAARLKLVKLTDGWESWQESLLQSGVHRQFSRQNSFFKEP